MQKFSMGCWFLTGLVSFLALLGVLSEFGAPSSPAVKTTVLAFCVGTAAISFMFSYAVDRISKK